MSMARALRELGVAENTLSPEEKAQFDSNGFLVVGQLLSSDQAAVMRAQLDALVLKEGEDAGRDFQQEKGSVILGTLLDKEAMFDVCCLHPRVLSAVAHAMGDDFGLSSLSART